METESELNVIVEEIENLQERLSQLQPKKDSLMKKCEEASVIYNWYDVYVLCSSQDNIKLY